MNKEIPAMVHREMLRIGLVKRSSKDVRVAEAEIVKRLWDRITHNGYDSTRWYDRCTKELEDLVEKYLDVEDSPLGRELMRPAVDDKHIEVLRAAMVRGMYGVHPPEVESLIEQVRARRDLARGYISYITSSRTF